MLAILATLAGTGAVLAQPGGRLARIGVLVTGPVIE